MGRNIKVIEAVNLPTPVRADIYLSQMLEISRRNVQGMLAKGAFTRDDRVLKKGDLIFSGNEIEVKGDVGEGSLLPDFTLNIPVIYEDENLIAVNKPAGVPVHPLSFSETYTLANWAIAHYPGLAGVGFSALESGILHRLDIETSGVVLIAKDNETFNSIREQFRGKKVRKIYTAVVEGVFNRGGWCRQPLYHKSRKKMAVYKEGVKAKRVFEAESHFRLVKVKNNFSLVEIEITTGVTHQIRVHLAYLGFPVAGDALYGKESEETALKGLHLHCQRISFYHPFKKKVIDVNAELLRKSNLFEVLSA